VGAHTDWSVLVQVVDGAMRARLSFPSMPDLRGTLHASLQHDGWLPEAVINVEGDRWVCPNHTCTNTGRHGDIQMQTGDEHKMVSPPW